MRIMLDRLDEDQVVFKSVLVDGVSTIPEEMRDRANEIIAEMGREPTIIEGNFEEVRFKFEPPLDFEEFEEFDERFCW